jgi:hypothetical protein
MQAKYLTTISEFHSHVTPLASGSSAASSTHSPAFSFPGTHLWEGHHRSPTVVPGMAVHNGAMGFLAWIASIWLGPGYSEAMRLIAAWASVIVTMNRLRRRY